MNIEENFTTETYRIEDFNEEIFLEEHILRHKEKNLLIVKPEYTTNFNNINVLKYQQDDKILYFSIKKFFDDGTGRMVVVVFVYDTSNNKLNVNLYYTSLSNSSLWRYLHLHNSMFGITRSMFGITYSKGYSYLSSTLVNLHIQKYINMHIPKTALSNEKSMTTYFEYNTPLGNSDKIKYNDLDFQNNLENRINTTDYICENIFFKIINVLFPLVTYVSQFSICIHKLEELVGRHDYTKSFLIDYSSYNYKYLLGNFNDYESYCDQINKLKENQTPDEKTILDDLYCTMLVHIKPNEFVDNFNRFENRKILNQFKNVLNDLFTKYFSIGGSTVKEVFDLKIVFSKNKDYPTIKPIECCNSIKSVDIKYKKNGREYILYYSSYACSEILGNKSMKTILYISPKNNSVNIFGLDDKYCVGGAFLNKVFEYQQQSRDVKPIHNEKSSSNYRFIGDFTNYDFLP